MDTVQVAQSLGIILALSNAGAAIAISAFLIPVLQKSPSPLLLEQFVMTYHRGGRIFPALSLVTSSLFAYVARDSYLVDNPRWRLFTTAALAILASPPYTLIFMLPTNNTLEAEAAKGERAHPKKDTVALLNKWQWMNYVRALFPLISGVVALVAVLP